MNDSELLDWAEKHPEKTLEQILCDWAMCGPGCRELLFNFRGSIKEAISKENHE